MTGTHNYDLATIRPDTFSDADRVGRAYRAGTPVILDVRDTDRDTGHRLVDFASGLAFATHGQLERVVDRVFLLSPGEVDVRDCTELNDIRTGREEQR